MILRKPYAFFIKKFKLFHVILTIMMSYLIYRTGLLLTFFNEFISSSNNVMGQDLSGFYFNLYMFLTPFLITLASIVILSVMYIKKKPYLFYIINIVISIAVLVVYNYTYGIIGELEIRLVDVRLVRANRDILLIAFIIQFLSAVITLIRATGFDIKKFNFGEDLTELEISEADSEEFEIDVALDTDLYKRNFRRRIRYARYVYLENKYMINIGGLILFSVVCFMIYLNIGVYNKVYKQNTAFLTRNFRMRITNSYITKTDYNKKIITDDTTLLIVEVGLQNRSNKPTSLETVKTMVNIGGRKFYPTIKHRDSLIDLGVVYQKELITNDSFQNYILVYEIPDNFLDGDVLYNYIDDSNYFSANLEVKTVKVKLNYQNLDDNQLVDRYNVTDTINLEGSVFKNTNIVINSFDIASQFQLKYRFCITTNDCYDSTEYIKPDLYNTYNKALIKLNGQINWDETLNINKDPDLFRFISMYGSLRYKIKDEIKNHNLILKEVKSKRVASNNYYIEVDEELKQAENISLIFKIRNKYYEYILK